MFSLLQCPVQEHETDFGAAFRVDVLRSHPNYRGGVWHDDVSTRAFENGEVTYGRVRHLAENIALR
jgi:hypothetical protein